MLISYGNTHCLRGWIVDEESAVGYCRVYYVHKGDVEYIKGDTRKKLIKGNLYIFPSAAAYSIIQNDENRLYCTYMHLDFYNLFIKELIEISLDEEKALKYILLAIKENISIDNIEILKMLTDTFTEYLIKYKYIEYPDKCVTKVFEYISENIDKNISVRTLSEISGYNEQYFIRLFKKNTGSTPYQYVITHRFIKAIKLLRSDMAVGDIAHEIGFKDIKAFSRAFKNRFGVSPINYRKNRIIKP